MVLSNILVEQHKKFVSLMIQLSPVVASKYLYRIHTGKKLDLKNPRDFNEKLQWLKLYWRPSLVVQCADKYEVRKYAKERGCQAILNDLYGVYTEASQIQWEKFPQKFVLKATHGCDFNIICRNKDKIDKVQSIKKLEHWLKIDCSKYYAEMHYSRIKPRIICEKYIQPKNGFLPIDYKVFCFNGTPVFVRVGRRNETDLSVEHFYLDTKWTELDIVKNKQRYEKLPSKPLSFDKMLSYAKILAKDFPFVRIDFYDYKNKPILGEMTFTPSACMATYYKEESLKKLGDMLILPSKYRYA